MMGYTKTCTVLLLCALASTNALQTARVLHIPEKIIGGVIDIVQNHKNKPTTPQPGLLGQTQAQQQVQQGYGWNSGYQSQIQSQAQYQYGNQAYPQTGNTYPQGGFVSAGQNTGSGYQQFNGPQGTYQNYPQNPSGGQFSGQQTGQQSSQFQSQVQNGFQGQQTQIQVQNPSFQPQQTGQYQQVGQNHGTGSYGGSQPSNTFVGNQPSGNYVGQTPTQGPPSHNYGVPSHPHGQAPQSSFGSNHYQGQTSTGGSYGGSQGFQMTTGSTTGSPGPTCVCQAWTKPLNDPLSDTPSQRNEEEKKPE